MGEIVIHLASDGKLAFRSNMDPQATVFLLEHVKGEVIKGGMNLAAIKTQGVQAATAAETELASLLAKRRNGAPG